MTAGVDTAASDPAIAAAAATAVAGAADELTAWVGDNLVDRNDATKEQLCGTGLGAEAQGVLDEVAGAAEAVGDAIALAKPVITLIKNVYDRYRDAKVVPAYALGLKQTLHDAKALLMK